MADTEDFYEMIGFAKMSEPLPRPLPASPDLRTRSMIFDLEGTLVEHTDASEAVAVPDHVHDCLSRLYERTGGAVGVVWERSLSDLEALFPDFRGLLFGSCGAEIRTADRMERSEIMGSDHVQRMQSILSALAEQMGGIAYEERPASAVLHFHKAPQRMAGCHQLLSRLVEECPEFDLRSKAMSLEVVPVQITRRRAMAALIRAWPDRTPFAFGKDSSDESMFALCNEAGGHSVRIGDGPSVAHGRLRCVAALQQLLADWAAKEAS